MDNPGNGDNINQRTVLDTNLIGEIIKSNKFYAPDQPFLGSSGRMTRHDSFVSPFADIDHSRGENQSGLEKLATGFVSRTASVPFKTLDMLSNVVSTFYGGIGTAGASLIDLAAGTNFKEKLQKDVELFDIASRSIFDTLDEGLKETFPVYVRNSYINGNIAERMWRDPASFISNELFDGVAFLVSAGWAGTPIRLATRGLSLTKALLKGGEGAKKTAAILGKVKKYTDLDSVSVLNGLWNAFGEGGIEAESVRTEVKEIATERLLKKNDSLPDDQKLSPEMIEQMSDEEAGKARGRVFLWNTLVLTIPNAFESKWLHGKSAVPMKELRRALVAKTLDEKALMKGFGMFRKGVKGIISEGFIEENAQTASELVEKRIAHEGGGIHTLKAYRDYSYMMGKGMKAIAAAAPSIVSLNLIKTAYAGGTEEDDLATAITLGSIIGGGMGMMGGARMRNQQLEALALARGDLKLFSEYAKKGSGYLQDDIKSVLREFDIDDIDPATNQVRVDAQGNPLKTKSHVNPATGNTEIDPHKAAKAMLFRLKDLRTFDGAIVSGLENNKAAFEINKEQAIASLIYGLANSERQLDYDDIVDLIDNHDWADLHALTNNQITDSDIKARAKELSKEFAHISNNMMDMSDLVGDDTQIRSFKSMVKKSLFHNAVMKRAYASMLTDPNLSTKDRETLTRLIEENAAAKTDFETNLPKSFKKFSAIFTQVYDTQKAFTEARGKLTTLPDGAEKDAAMAEVKKLSYLVGEMASVFGVQTNPGLDEGRHELFMSGFVPLEQRHAVKSMITSLPEALAYQRGSREFASKAVEDFEAAYQALDPTDYAEKLNLLSELEQELSRYKNSIDPAVFRSFFQRLESQSVSDHTEIVRQGEGKADAIALIAELETLKDPKHYHDEYYDPTGVIDQAVTAGTFNGVPIPTSAEINAPGTDAAQNLQNLITALRNSLGDTVDSKGFAQVFSSIESLLEGPGVSQRQDFADSYHNVTTDILNSQDPARIEALQAEQKEHLIGVHSEQYLEEIDAVVDAFKVKEAEGKPEDFFIAPEQLSKLLRALDHIKTGFEERNKDESPEAFKISEPFRQERLNRIEALQAELQKILNVTAMGLALREQEQRLTGDFIGAVISLKLDTQNASLVEARKINPILKLLLEPFSDSQVEEFDKAMAEKYNGVEIGHSFEFYETFLSLVVDKLTEPKKVEVLKLLKAQKEQIATQLAPRPSLLPMYKNAATSPVQILRDLLKYQLGSRQPTVEAAKFIASGSIVDFLKIKDAANNPDEILNFILFYENVLGLHFIEEAIVNHHSNKALLEAEIELMNEIENAGEPTPTLQQLVALRALLKNLMSDSKLDPKQANLILGTAGSGKSEILIKGLIKILKKRTNLKDTEMVVVSPYQAISDNLHTALGLPSGPKLVQEIIANPDLVKNKKLLVIDEAVAIDTKTYIAINKIIADNPGLKVIYAGDHAQFSAELFSDILSPQGFTSVKDKRTTAAFPLSVVYRSNIASIINFFKSFQFNENPVNSVQTFMSHSRDLLMSNLGSVFGVYGTANALSRDGVTNAEIVEMANTATPGMSRVIVVASLPKAEAYRRIVSDPSVKIMLINEIGGLTFDHVYIDILPTDKVLLSNSVFADTRSFNQAIFTAASRAKNFVATNGNLASSSVSANISNEKLDYTQDFATNKELMKEHYEKLTILNNLLGGAKVTAKVAKTTVTPPPGATPGQPPTGPVPVDIKEGEEVTQVPLPPPIKKGIDDIDGKLDKDPPIPTGTVETTGGGIMRVLYPEGAQIRRGYIKPNAKVHIIKAEDTKTKAPIYVGVTERYSEATGKVIPNSYVITHIFGDRDFTDTTTLGPALLKALETATPAQTFDISRLKTAAKSPAGITIRDIKDYSLLTATVESVSKMNFLYDKDNSAPSSVEEALLNFYHGYYTKSGQKPLKEWLKADGTVNVEKLVAEGIIQLTYYTHKEIADPATTKSSFKNRPVGIPFLVIKDIRTSASIETEPYGDVVIRMDPVNLHSGNPYAQQMIEFTKSILELENLTGLRYGTKTFNDLISNHAKHFQINQNGKQYARFFTLEIKKNSNGIPLSNAEMIASLGLTSSAYDAAIIKHLSTLTTGIYGAGQKNKLFTEAEANAEIAAVAGAIKEKTSVAGQFTVSVSDNSSSKAPGKMVKIQEWAPIAHKGPVAKAWNNIARANMTADMTMENARAIRIHKKTTGEDATSITMGKSLLTVKDTASQFFAVVRENIRGFLISVQDAGINPQEYLASIGIQSDTDSIDEIVNGIRENVVEAALSVLITAQNRPDTRIENVDELLTYDELSRLRQKHTVLHLTSEVLHAMFGADAFDNADGTTSGLRSPLHIANFKRPGASDQIGDFNSASSMVNTAFKGVEPTTLRLKFEGLPVTAPSVKPSSRPLPRNLILSQVERVVSEQEEAALFADMPDKARPYVEAIVAKINPRKVLEDIAADVTNPLHRLASIILADSTLDLSNVYFINTNEAKTGKGRTVNFRYDKYIFLAQDDSNILLHEIIHSITVDRLNKGHLDMIRDPDSAEALFYSEVVEVINELKKNPNWRTFLQDTLSATGTDLEIAKELMANLSNPTTRRALAAIEYKSTNKSFLQTIYSKILQYLGIHGDSNALERLELALSMVETGTRRSDLDSQINAKTEEQLQRIPTQAFSSSELLSLIQTELSASAETNLIGNTNVNSGGKELLNSLVSILLNADNLGIQVETHEDNHAPEVYNTGSKLVINSRFLAEFKSNPIGSNSAETLAILENLVEIVTNKALNETFEGDTKESAAQLKYAFDALHKTIRNLSSAKSSKVKAALRSAPSTSGDLMRIFTSKSNRAAFNKAGVTVGSSELKSAFGTYLDYFNNFINHLAGVTNKKGNIKVSDLAVHTFVKFASDLIENIDSSDDIPFAIGVPTEQIEHEMRGRLGKFPDITIRFATSIALQGGTTLGAVHNNLLMFKVDENNRVAGKVARHELMEFVVRNVLEPTEIAKIKEELAESYPGISFDSFTDLAHTLATIYENTGTTFLESVEDLREQLSNLSLLDKPTIASLVNKVNIGLLAPAVQSSVPQGATTAFYSKIKQTFGSVEMYSIFKNLAVNILHKTTNQPSGTNQIRKTREEALAVLGNILKAEKSKVDRKTAMLHAQLSKYVTELENRKARKENVVAIEALIVRAKEALQTNKVKAKVLDKLIDNNGSPRQEFLELIRDIFPNWSAANPDYIDVFVTGRTYEDLSEEFENLEKKLKGISDYMKDSREEEDTYRKTTEALKDFVSTIAIETEDRRYGKKKTTEIGLDGKPVEVLKYAVRTRMLDPKFAYVKMMEFFQYLDINNLDTIYLQIQSLKKVEDLGHNSMVVLDKLEELILNSRKRLSRADQNITMVMSLDAKTKLPLYHIVHSPVNTNNITNLNLEEIRYLQSKYPELGIKIVSTDVTSGAIASYSLNSLYQKANKELGINLEIREFNSLYDRVTALETLRDMKAHFGSMRETTYKMVSIEKNYDSKSRAMQTKVSHHSPRFRGAVKVIREQIKQDFIQFVEEGRLPALRDKLSRIKSNDFEYVSTFLNTVTSYAYAHILIDEANLEAILSRYPGIVTTINKSIGRATDLMSAKKGSVGIREAVEYIQEKENTLFTKIAEALKESDDHLFKIPSIVSGEKKRIYRYTDTSYMYQILTSLAKDSTFKGSLEKKVIEGTSYDQVYRSAFFRANPFMKGLAKLGKITEHDVIKDKFTQITTAYSRESNAEFYLREFVAGFFADIKNRKNVYTQFFYPLSERPKVPGVDVKILNKKEVYKGLESFVEQEIERLDASPSQARKFVNATILQKALANLGLLNKDNEVYKTNLTNNKAAIAKEMKTILDSKAEDLFDELVELDVPMDADIPSVLKAFATSKGSKVTEEDNEVENELGEDLDELILDETEDTIKAIRENKQISKIVTLTNKQKKKQQKGLPTLETSKKDLLPILKVFVANHYINSHFVMQLVAGDLNQFNNARNVIKRMSGPSGPKRLPWVGEGGMRKESKMLIMRDTTENEFEKFLQDLVMEKEGLDSWEQATQETKMELEAIKSIFPDSFKRQDGAGWYHPLRKAQYQKGFGANYNIRGVTKPQYFNVHPEGSVYFKYAETELSDELVESFPILKLLRDTLEGPVPTAEQARNTSFTELLNVRAEGMILHSGSKLFNPEGMADFDSLTPDNLKDSEYVENLEKGILTIKNAAFGMQLNPDHGTREQKLSLPLQLLFFALLSENFTAETKDLFDSIAFKNGIKLRQFEDNISEGFRRYILNLLKGKGSEKAFELFEEGVSHNNPLIEKKLISQIMSKFSRDALKSTLQGAKLQLVAEAGDSKRFDGSSSPLSYHFKDGVMYAEVYAPREMFSDEHAAAIERGEAFFANGLDAFGFRIPLTGLHSAIPIRVVGWSSSREADTASIIAPKWLTVLHGSDYDADAIFMAVMQKIDKRITFSDFTAFNEYIFKAETELESYLQIAGEKKVKNKLPFIDLSYESVLKDSLPALKKNMAKKLNMLEGDKLSTAEIALLNIFRAKSTPGNGTLIQKLTEAGIKIKNNRIVTSNVMVHYLVELENSLKNLRDSLSKEEDKKSYTDVSEIIKELITGAIFTEKGNIKQGFIDGITAINLTFEIDEYVGFEQINGKMQMSSAKVKLAQEMYKAMSTKDQALNKEKLITILEMYSLNQFNEIISKMIGSADSFTDMIAPISKELFNGKGGVIEKLEALGEVFEDNLDLGLISGKLEGFRSVSEGNALRGIWVNNLKSLSYFYKAGEVTRPVLDDQGNEVYEPDEDGNLVLVTETVPGTARLGLNIGFINSAGERLTLDRIVNYNIETQLKRNTYEALKKDNTPEGAQRLAEFIATNPNLIYTTWQTHDAAVNVAIDNTKDQDLYKLGLTKHNGSLFSILISVGMPEFEAVLLLKNPVISKLFSDKDYKKHLVAIRDQLEKVLGDTFLEEDMYGNSDMLISAYQESSKFKYNKKSGKLEISNLNPGARELKNLYFIVDTLLQIEKGVEPLKVASKFFNLTNELPSTFGELMSALVRIEDIMLDIGKVSGIQPIDISSTLSDNYTIPDADIGMKDTFFFHAPRLKEVAPHLFQNFNNILRLKDLLQDRFIKYSEEAYSIVEGAASMIDISRDSEINKLTLADELIKFLYNTTLPERIRKDKVTVKMYGRDVDLAGPIAWSQRFAQNIQVLKSLFKSEHIQNSFLEHLLVTTTLSKDLKTVLFLDGNSTKIDEIAQYESDFNKLKTVIESTVFRTKNNRLFVKLNNNLNQYAELKVTDGKLSFKKENNEYVIIAGNETEQENQALIDTFEPSEHFKSIYRPVLTKRIAEEGEELTISLENNPSLNKQGFSPVQEDFLSFAIIANGATFGQSSYGSVIDSALVKTSDSKLGSAFNKIFKSPDLISKVKTMFLLHSLSTFYEEFSKTRLTDPITGELVTAKVDSEKVIKKMGKLEVDGQTIFYERALKSADAAAPSIFVSGNNLYYAVHPYFISGDKFKPFTNISPILKVRTASAAEVTKHSVFSFKATTPQGLFQNIKQAGITGKKVLIIPNRPFENEKDNVEFINLLVNSDIDFSKGFRLEKGLKASIKAAIAESLTGETTTYYQSLPISKSRLSSAPSLGQISRFGLRKNLDPTILTLHTNSEMSVGKKFDTYTEIDPDLFKDGPLEVRLASRKDMFNLNTVRVKIRPAGSPTTQYINNNEVLAYPYEIVDAYQEESTQQEIQELTDAGQEVELIVDWDTAKDPTDATGKSISLRAQREFNFEGHRFKSVEQAYLSLRTGTFNKQVYNWFEKQFTLGVENPARNLPGKDDLQLLGLLVIDSLIPNNPHDSPNVEAITTLRQHTDISYWDKNKNLEYNETVTEAYKLAKQRADAMDDVNFAIGDNRQEQIAELFESNPELANSVYGAMGLGNLKSKVTLSKKFADTYNIIFNGETIGAIDIPSGLEGDTTSISDVNIKPEFRGKGLGVETYKAAMKIAKKPLESFMATDEANRVWNSLFKQGLAKKTDTGFVTVDSKITPQQKQEAQEAYSNYLNTVFPDSKVKDIVYHGTKSIAAFEKFVTNSELLGFYFTNYKDYANKYGKVIYSILNVTNPRIYDTIDKKEYSKIANLISKDEFSKYDGINIKNFLGSDELVVFEPEQIHILGSKQDMQGFKEFVNSESSANQVAESIAKAFFDRFNIKVNLIDSATLDKLLSETESAEDFFFRILDEVDVFNSKNPAEAKAFITKVFQTVTTKEDAKKAYRKLATKYHPDKQGGSEEIMKHLNDSNDKFQDGTINAKQSSGEYRGENTQQYTNQYSRQSNYRQKSAQEEAEEMRKREQQVREEMFKYFREQAAEQAKRAEQAKQTKKAPKKQGIWDTISNIFKSSPNPKAKTSSPASEILTYDRMQQIGAKLNERERETRIKLENEKQRARRESDLEYDRGKITYSQRQSKESEITNWADQYSTEISRFYAEKHHELTRAFNNRIPYTYSQTLDGKIAGLYNSRTNEAYILTDRIDDTTFIHEAFSHPFIEAIKIENKELYDNLLSEAKSDSSIVDYVNENYEGQPQSVKDVEYITRAIDLDAKGKLKNKSLIEYIKEFWNEVTRIVNDIFGGQEAKIENIVPTTTISELVDFILTSDQKLDLNRSNPADLDSMIQKMIESGEITYTNEEGEPCAKAGLNTGFRPGSKWQLMDVVEGKTHSQGGVDISIQNGRVSYASSDPNFKAEDGLFISGGVDPIKPKDPIAGTYTLPEVTVSSKQRKNDMRLFSLRNPLNLEAEIDKTANNPTGRQKIEAINPAAFRDKIKESILRDRQKKADLFAAERAAERNPQGDMPRGQWIEGMNAEDRNSLLKDPKYQPTSWQKFEQGVYSMATASFLKNLSSPVFAKSRGLTTQEAYQENTPLNLLEPATILGKVAQSVGRDNYSVSDGLKGVQNDAGTFEQIVKDPLNLVGSVGMSAIKGLQGARRLSAARKGIGLKDIAEDVGTIATTATADNIKKDGINLSLFGLFNRSKVKSSPLDYTGELARANADLTAFTNSPYNLRKLSDFRPNQKVNPSNTEVLFHNDPVARERFKKLMDDNQSLQNYKNTDNWTMGNEGSYAARDFGDLDDLAVVNKNIPANKIYNAGIHEGTHSRSVRLPATSEERKIIDKAWGGLKDVEGNKLPFLEGEAVQGELRMMLGDKLGKRKYTEKDIPEIKSKLQQLIAQDHPYVQNVSDFDISKIITSLNRVGLAGVTPTAAGATIQNKSQKKKNEKI